MKRFSDCVVLCAGRGTRMGSEHPKVLIEVNNKAILQYVIDFWKPQVERFIFVVGYKAFEITKYLETKSGIKNYVEVVQYEQKGIAHALLQAESKLSSNFVVALGDCIQSGHFIYPKSVQLGCGVWVGCPNWDEITKSYTVFTQHCEGEKEWIYRVIEKPNLVDEIESAYCGMGTYFFDRSVFKYIKNTEPSRLRNEIEITDVIQGMIDEGEVVNSIRFDGEYINMTSPEDIKEAELRIK
jgi:dTDP-glucose pyrophosphorylase